MTMVPTALPVSDSTIRLPRASALPGSEASSAGRYPPAPAPCRWRAALQLAISCALAIAVVDPLSSQGIELELQEITSGLVRPLVVTHAGDGSGRLFVAEQGGRVMIVKGGTLLPTPFLDVGPLLETTGNEQGLLGLAFHPDYWQPDDQGNGLFYINYTEPEANPPEDCPEHATQVATCDANTVVARYSVSVDDPDLADSASAAVLFKVNQPRRNHNGGNLAFGPDDMLYVALGDGGGGGDPYGHAQDLSTLHGAILRIDVDGSPPAEPNDLCGLDPALYGVPPDNPFTGQAGACDEIWAYGLRNPWRFSFDRDTGDLWVGDVGQRTIEEIDYQSAASTGGENYGWSCYEGSIPYPGGPTCSGPVVFPVLEYPHSNPSDPENTGRSVTGGYRYRGTLHPQLGSVYLYADFSEGRIWGTVPRCDGAWQSRLHLDTEILISSFGEDEAGELYLADLGGGRVLRVALAPTSGGPFIGLQPSSIDFGSVEVGTRSEREVVLANANAGPEALFVSALAVSDPARFTLDPAGGSDPCGTATPCLAPEESCSVMIAFEPAGAGPAAESLAASGNSPSGTVDLVAAAVPCSASGVRTLPPATVGDTRLEEACRVLAAADYQITSGGRVTFRAGVSMELGNGFSVGDGGTFSGVLDPALLPP